MIDQETQNFIKKYIQETVSALEPGLNATLQSAVSGYDRSRGYDRSQGADDPGTAPGMQSQVTTAQSNLNPIVVAVPAGSPVSAPLFFWGDLIDQNIGITANVPLAFTSNVTTISSVATAVSNLVITPANFNPPSVDLSPATGSTLLGGSGTIGFLPPQWMAAGPSLNSLNYFSSYQLTVAFLGQNVAFFDLVNAFSSELGNQAPVLRGSNITQQEASPYGSTLANVVPFINAVTPQDMQQNQVIAALGFVNSLFHYMVYNAVNNSNAAVTVTMVFNSAMMEHRGQAYGEKIKNAKAKGQLPSPQAGRSGLALLNAPRTARAL